MDDWYVTWMCLLFFLHLWWNETDSEHSIIAHKRRTSRINNGDCSSSRCSMAIERISSRLDLGDQCVSPLGCISSDWWISEILLAITFWDRILGSDDCFTQENDCYSWKGIEIGAHSLVHFWHHSGQNNPWYLWHHKYDERLPLLDGCYSSEPFPQRVSQSLCLLKISFVFSVS